MVFVTLGSQKFQFDRLLKTIDDLLEKGCIQQKVSAQVGYSEYLPRNFECARFLDREAYSSMIEKAEVVITHGGTGAIMEAVKRGKKVIAVARLTKYGEHVDDHQLQIISQFEGMNLIYACRDCCDVEHALHSARTMSIDSYRSGSKRIISSIETFIDGGKV